MATKNTYHDVSQKTKDIINSGRNNTKEVTKNVLNYTEKKVLQYELFKQKLADDLKKGTVKSISFAKEKGMIVVNY